ncbi:MAG: hypothetical protein Q4F95_02845 [Oscillospiraceae bacterium]|nr:hypothetical protein [Oscillospiraceae bacterium]
MINKRTAAVAGAAILIFAAWAAAVIINLNKDGSDADSQTALSAVITASAKQSENSIVSTTTKQTTVYETAQKSDTQTSQAVDADEPVKTKSGFESKEELLSYIASNTADISPLKVGYEATGYAQTYSEFYNVEFTDEGYKCTVADSDARKGWEPLFPTYNEDTHIIRQVTKCELSKEDISDFSRIFSYINKTAGEDSYYIYDVYKYDFRIDYNGCGNHHISDTSERSDFCVEIILKDYYDKFKKFDFDYSDFTVTYMIVNTHTFSDDNSSEPVVKDTDSVLISEYPYFRRSHEISEAFLNEFNELYSDYAVTIGCFEYGGSTGVARPFTSWIRNTALNDFYYGYYLQSYSESACAENMTPQTEDPYLNISLYFKPSTTEEEVTAHLREMKPLLTKYNVYNITSDVLTNENDFVRIKGSGGYIPDKLINSSTSSPDKFNRINRYHCSSLDFYPWGAR